MFMDNHTHRPFDVVSLSLILPRLFLAVAPRHQLRHIRLG